MPFFFFVSTGSSVLGSGNTTKRTKRKIKKKERKTHRHARCPLTFFRFYFVFFPFLSQGVAHFAGSDRHTASRCFLTCIRLSTPPSAQPSASSSSASSSSPPTPSQSLPSSDAEAAAACQVTWFYLFSKSLFSDTFGVARGFSFFARRR